MESNMNNKLNNHQIARYSRQLILPEIGVAGQRALQKSNVLIVGAGGLGCPVAIYLAAAGIGHIGIVDYDDVELNNLHRQILHTEDRINSSKCESVCTGIRNLNSAIRCTPYKLLLSSDNAIDIIQQFDIIVDCTDNVATRYLLNDACVLCHRSLVSGSALRFEGQLTVYNHKEGPCYRCLYPTPPPAETVTNCSDGGVLGVVPGIIGDLQALEVIKIAVGLPASYSRKLLLFDGLDGTFRTIQLRSRQPSCAVCGDHPTITKLIDYEVFCQSSPSDKSCTVSILKPDERLSVVDYKSMIDTAAPHMLIDVRPEVEFDICNLTDKDRDSFIVRNIPLGQIKKNIDAVKSVTSKLRELCKTNDNWKNPTVIAICHHGNDSQKAVKLIKEQLEETDVIVMDVQGGLHRWALQVDNNFPLY